MAYEPKEWACGDVVTADALNNIEQGIADANELPSVTSADNGKVLGVDGGEYVLTEVESGVADGSITNAKLASEVLAYVSDMKGNDVHLWQASNLRVLVLNRITFNSAKWESADSAGTALGFTHKLKSTVAPAINPKLQDTMFNGVLIDAANSNALTPVVCMLANTTVYVRSATSTALALSDTAYIYGTVTYVQNS